MSAEGSKEMTAIRAAFEAVGVTPAQDRLRRIAVEALARNPRSLDCARDNVFHCVRNDAELLWELFEKFRAQAVNELLNASASALRQEAGRGHSGSAGNSRCALAPTEVSDRAARFGVTDNSVQRQTAARSDAQSKRPTAARGIAGMSAVATVAEASLLDTVILNGMRVGDMTAREAIAWASSHRKRVEFVRLLTANLPLDLPIRKFRTPEDAAALYKQAETVNDI